MYKTHTVHGENLHSEPLLWNHVIRVEYHNYARRLGYHDNRRDFTTKFVWRMCIESEHNVVPGAGRMIFYIKLLKRYMSSLEKVNGLLVDVTCFMQQ